MIRRGKSALLGVVLGAVSLLGAGCGSSSSLAATGQSIDLITQIQQAPYLVSHSGIRRLESHYTLDGHSDHLIYREEVVTDGLGGFAIQPLGAVSGDSLPAGDLQLIQKVREGFHFRYRDFLVRDLAAFLQNYQLKTLGQVVQIAGRDCLEVSIQRQDGSLSFDVAMDVETGLVLSYDEYDGSGQLYTSMVYETFDPAPSLAGVTLHQPDNQEQTLDLEASAQSQVGFQPYIPKLPQGSGLFFLDASRVTDLHGNVWVKLTYTDGVETVFFLDGGPRMAKVGAIGEKSTGSLASATSPSGPSVPDKVLVFHEGPLTVAWGKVMDHDLIAVGKLGRADLMGLLESALPGQGSGL